MDMIPRQNLPPGAASLAAGQHDTITYAQLLRSGVSEKVIRRMSRDWIRFGRGVHCLSTPSWLSAVWAGLLLGGDGAVAGGLAAAHLYGWLPTEPARITIWDDIHTTPWRINDWHLRFRRSARPGRGQVRHTPPEDTLLDAADESGTDTTLHLLTRAFTERHTTPARVLRRMGERSRQPHRRVIMDACDHGMEGVESILEWHYLTRIEQAHGLPSASRQVRLVGSNRCDAFYETQGVIVELDGRLGHLEDFRDHRRDNRNALEYGALTLRYGSRDVFHAPCEIAEEVARTLVGRGWRGSMRACATCVPRFQR